MSESTTNSSPLSLSTTASFRHGAHVLGNTRFGKLIGIAGFSFFLIKGLLWLVVPWIVYQIGSV